MRPLTRLLTPVALAAGLTVTASCGLGTAGGFTPTAKLAGPIEDVKPIDGEIAVGSKNFTEQLILGKMAVMLLKSAGADVKDLTNIPGSASARQAQLSDQIQLQWEYTGTAWISYLGQTTPIPDSRKQYEAVQERDRRENNLIWLEPAPMNNTYGFAAKREVIEQLGITKMSELTTVPKAKRTFCVESEFSNRNDGLQPMLKTYGVPLGSGVPKNQLKTLDTGAIYSATDQGACTFGEVFTTDGRIKTLDLVVLEDDKKFFPNYNVAPVVTQQAMQDNPQLAALFNPVSAKLDDKTLIQLNAKVDVDGQEPTDVAYEWLTSEGFLRE